jgi:folate-binding protein YgfZ
MTPLAIRDLHQRHNAVFTEVNGAEVVDHCGEFRNEYAALTTSAGVIDLSFRSRLCLTGADRQTFLNGQVTNNVKDLNVGEGCYAALVTAKGKVQSDLNIYILENEILLDFEPGYSAAVAERLEKYVIADDVQIVDVSAHFGLLSVQGPKSEEVLCRLNWQFETPQDPMQIAMRHHPSFGEIYICRLHRTGTSGFDLYLPTTALEKAADELITAARGPGGLACGWQALETARIEAGIPRFGADMDESNLAPETGIEMRAISYSKGCYIGQEVIARIRTYGQVAKALRVLKPLDDSNAVPQRGDRLFAGDREVGHITSAVLSPAANSPIALGYVRREHNAIGTDLVLRASNGDRPVRVLAEPFPSRNPK